MGAGCVIGRVNGGETWLPLGVHFEHLEFGFPSRVPTKDPQAAPTQEVTRLRRKTFKLSARLLSVRKIGRQKNPVFPICWRGFPYLHPTSPWPARCLRPARRADPGPQRAYFCALSGRWRRRSSSHRTEGRAAFWRNTTEMIIITSVRQRTTDQLVEPEK